MADICTQVIRCTCRCLPRSSCPITASFRGSGFAKDGQWKLAVQPATKDKGGYLRLESRRWTFVTKQIEGTYPNWRNITDDVREFSGTIEVSDQAAEAISRIVPRLPGDDTPNHTVGLYTVSGRLYLRGSNKDQERATEVEVPGVTVSGDPATVYVNRQYLLKAIGLWSAYQIGVQEPLKPLRFSDGGNRQMIVMPVRVGCQRPRAESQCPGPRAGPTHHPGRAHQRRAGSTRNHQRKPPARRKEYHHAERKYQRPWRTPRRRDFPNWGKTQFGAGPRPDRVREEHPPGSRHEPEQSWPTPCARYNGNAASASGKSAPCAARSRRSRPCACSQYHQSPERAEGPDAS